MRVRWTIVVEGSTLTEMRAKAEQAFKEWLGVARIKDEEPIFLDAEPDVIVESIGEPNRIISYKAWASRNFEVEDR